jgi:hypothetical protein
MEHLPNIKVAESQFPKVPYLCNEEYDGLFWEEYGSRRGWDSKRFLARDFTEHPPKETASFLQNWLFFGTINNIIGSNKFIPSTAFLTKDEKGSLWITTASIDEHIRLWAEYFNGLENDMATLKSLTSQMHRCLNDVAIFSDILYKSDNCPLPVEVVLSIKVLGCTIESALAWYWNVKTPRNWGLKDIAVSRMLQTEWCLRDVSMASHYLSEITMYYASYAKRDYKQQDHSRCTEKLCVVNQIEEVSYRTQHTSAKCQCHHIEPDQEQIRQILQKGQVPVISLTSKTAPDNSQTLEVGVKAHANLRWFIAISHVWSDGLGNPNCNSLPHCQVRVLYDLLVDLPWEELYGGFDEAVQEDFVADPYWEGKWKERIERVSKKVVPTTRSFVNKVRDRRRRPISLWMDTLCVPLEKEYRKMAIAGLKTVYSDAMITIVLDSELQRTSGLCTDQETFLRVATSGWMRRAWTFQEGVLANARMKVKFADTLVNLPKLIEPNISDMSNDGVDWYISQNPRVVAAFESVGKCVNKWTKNYEQDKRAAKEAERKKNFSLSAYIMEDTRTFFKDMKKVWYIAKDRNNNEDKLQRIIAAWNGLEWRATSRENDKFIIFATACIMMPEDLETVQILINTPAQDRMKMWISQQVYVPEGFLFTKGPRLSELGWRWAPALVHHNAIVHDTGVDRAPGDTSLKVMKPGFLIFAGGGLMGCRAFSFRERDFPQRYKVKLDTEYLPTAGSQEATRVQGLSVGGTLGLVMCKSGFDIKIGSGSYTDLKEEAGALIEVTSQSDGLISGAFICTVDVKMEEFDAAGDGSAMVLARSVKTDQVWSVS